jgi:type VI protein secretion system component Hcp
MDNAQLYLSLVRPSMIPVVGEAADDLFRQQIEVTGWKWGFHNLQEQKEAARKQEHYAQRADHLATSTKTRDLQAERKRIEAKFARMTETLKSDLKDPTQMASWSKSIDAIDEQLKKDLAELYVDRELSEQLIKQDHANTEQGRLERQRQQALDGQDLRLELEEQKFSFSFTKRIDLATTQMLNSMKAGDRFPLAIFTMHQYSANNPMSLVIKIEGLRLVEYGFVVDASDTMTDLKEEWTCDFKGFSYVYQNRRSFAKPSLGSVSDAKQIAAKAATQGTVRTFVMLPRKL